MTHRIRWGWVAIALVLALGLAACGGDDDDTSTPAPEGASGGQTPELNLNTGPGLTLGGADDATPERGMAGRLPGCDAGDSEDCPSPVNLPLDAEASGDGITVSYLSRYFTVLGADDNPEGVPIRVGPGERFPFEQQAQFDVYLADSVENAIATIEATDSGAWTSAQGWNGTIAVQKDDTQDPPVNTSIGAFELPDGRVIVLKAVTTGQFGWDLWSVIYEHMLDSLVVEPQESAAG